MTFVFASTNADKVKEIREILSGAGVDVLALGEGHAVPAAPEEAGSSCEENARIKAIGYANALKQPCLADDSGLEVDALGGAPGVHSARYAGTGSTRQERDQANRNKLLQELGALGEVPRTGRLVCALCLCDAQGRVLFETRGLAEAWVTEAPRGNHGFGYDSLLLIPELSRTIAELSPTEWNARSHRGQAARNLLAWLQAGGQLDAGDGDAVARFQM